MLLKDTALGTIIAYDNLTCKVSILQNLYTNAIPAAIVIACIYIPLNLALSGAVTGLERRSRRRQITAVPSPGDEEPVARADDRWPPDGPALSVRRRRNGRNDGRPRHLRGRGPL